MNLDLMIPVIDLVLARGRDILLLPLLNWLSSSSSPDDVRPSMSSPPIILALSNTSSGTNPIWVEFFRSVSITLVWSFRIFSLELLFSFFGLFIRFGVRTIARFEVPILLSFAWDATFAANLIKYCSVCKWGNGRRRHRYKMACAQLFSQSSRWHFAKHSLSWLVNKGSGSCRKNCFSKLATSWAWTSEMLSPFSIFCCAL